MITVVLSAACSAPERTKPDPIAELQPSQPAVEIESTKDVGTADVPVESDPSDQQLDHSTTGIPEIDKLITIVLRNDIEAKLALIHFTKAGCTKVMGLGGPPKCQGEQEEGTQVQYFPILGPGEGSTVLPEDIEELLDFQVESLYAAYRRSDKPIIDQHYAPGTYGLVFTSSPEEHSTQYILVHSNDDGQIVRLDYLVWNPEAIIEQEAGELLILPPEEAEPDSLD